MLPEAKVKEAERLLAASGLSQRKIAKAIGISRATISAIAAGRRPDYEARRQARLAELEPLGPLMRCPGCGGMVYSPCRLCRVRKVQEQEREARRLLRRRARERALARLLMAVKRAAEDSSRARETVRHLPLAPALGPSDCK